MIEEYAALAGRIRQELADIENAVARAERALVAARKQTQDQDLYIDSAALNLHDFYGGFERIFQQIAATVDSSLPSSSEWHRELLEQMTGEVDSRRPAVLAGETSKALEEYLRFRHVVRNIYAFVFDPERIESLVLGVRPVFSQARVELLAFAQLLEQVGRE